MAARYEFECKDGHAFDLWSDDARCCPQCGTDLLRRVYKTPPSIGTGRPAKVDALVRREFEARGITNVQGGGHEGDKEKITYKSTEAELKVQKIYRDLPQLDPKNQSMNEIQTINQQVQQKWSSVGVKGIIKSGLGSTPEQAMVRNTIMNAGRNDRLMTNRVYRKDPESLQVKKG